MSIQAAPEEESNTVEEQYVAVAVLEEQVVKNSTVDDGVHKDAVTVPEDERLTSTPLDLSQLRESGSCVVYQNNVDEIQNFQNTPTPEFSFVLQKQFEI